MFSLARFVTGLGFDECCKDSNDGLFRFRKAFVGTTTTTTSTTSTTTAGKIIEPIEDVTVVAKKGRRFIARLRKSGSSEILSNSRIVTIENIDASTSLPDCFEIPFLEGQVTTSKQIFFQQKNIATVISTPTFIQQENCSDNREIVRVVGSITGKVVGGAKGTPYGLDSDIGTAAVHAGIINLGSITTVRRIFIQYYKNNTNSLKLSFEGNTYLGVTTSSRIEGCGFYFDTSYVGPPIATDGFYFFKETFTATANQKIFTVTRPADYLSQQCLIFQNGILLDISEYTDTPGSTGTITLANETTVGDIITIMSFKSTKALTGITPSFSRRSEIIYGNNYFLSGFSVTEGVDLLFVNGVILPKTDYTINNGVINFPDFVAGTLTMILWSLNNLSEPNGNPLNITTNTVITQTTYNTPFDPLAFNLYNNGVLMVVAVDYTVGVDSYTLTVSPTSNLNTLLQQSFTRIGS